jgi:PHD/YefM family antitoxin component YafN of YafNO toxin-antitoxin module
MSIPQEHYIIDTNGNKTGVVISLKRYQQLMEDLHDMAVVAERRDEETISLKEMKRRLKQDVIL